MIIFKSEFTKYGSGTTKILFSYKDIPIFGTITFNRSLNIKESLNYLWNAYTSKLLMEFKQLNDIN